MKPDTSKNTIIKSFHYALEGLLLLFRERNFRIHILIVILVIISGFGFKIERIEWVAVLLVAAIVLTLEAVNSCLERICDMISPEYDQRIKAIKDIAAGAVFIATIIAVIIGCLVFTPYIYACFVV